jgi:catechol 2,3-dioxygenase-like lactoylglutathione lyase family enzyme
MRIDRLDHLVLTVADIDRTVRFYCDVLGMEAIVFGGGRTGLKFGRSKINLHQVGHELQPNALHPSVGSADLCFIADDSLDSVQAELERSGIPIVEGPVQRTGALGTLLSVYVRDPDGNLVEISNQLSG